MGARILLNYQLGVAETQPEAEPDQDEISAEPEAESEPASEPEPATEPEPSTEPEPAAEPAVEGATSWTPRGDFHAMDCTDMVGQSDIS